MIWWVRQPSRARSERVAIAELEEASDWLENVTWKLSPQAQLAADFDLLLGDRSVPLSITYPAHFPDMPPQVVPREDVRLSGHQYGAGGELCLEYRPDNWDPALTGSAIIESAHRLLAGERPVDGQAQEVPSAHRASLGQSARASSWRLLLPAEARAALLRQQPNRPALMELSEHLAAEHWLAIPRRVFAAEAVLWDATSEVPLFNLRKGCFVRLVSPFAKHSLGTYEGFRTVVDAFGIHEASARVAESEEELPLLVECGGAFRLLSLSPGAGERRIWTYTTVPLPPQAARLPQKYRRLSSAKVAIVGCGSVGSKVATSLARSGVEGFVLVDGDLVIPGNLVRNDLDWREVGLNKPDALAARLMRLRPTASIEKRRIDLGGQESSGSTDATMQAIGRCDVIVDATAEPQVFNLLGSIARNERRMLVWGEVFGGGIGGIVARLRPDEDPTPHAARQQLLAWCDRWGKEAPQSSVAQYGLSVGEDAPPMVADDSDVTVIAAHMSRLVVDGLVHERSNFPHQAYAIGLKSGWIFDAPFDTYPISLATQGSWGAPQDENLEEELDRLVEEFFPKNDAGPAA